MMNHLPLGRCTMLIALALPLPAQSQSTRLVHVTVTDPLGRFVTGMEQERFEITENRIRRPITAFADLDSPMALAVVGDAQLPASSLGLDDVLIQTRSVSEALQQLSSSTSPRKTLVITAAATDLPSVPFDVQILRVKSDDLLKAIVELHSEYLLQFESGDASSRVEVVLKQPRGLPPLRVNLK